MPQGDHLGWQRFALPSPEEIPISEFALAHAGRCVLITGAGGSIGSALARTLAGAGVKRLLLLDSCESSLLDLQSQLASGTSAAEAVYGSIGDAGLLDSLFRRHRVDLIYHAAAWKHVAPLESDPFGAVQNNAIGTYTLAQSAIRGAIPKLVLISTDKAVNPHSIMGVSKRIAELAVISLSRPACAMNAVRLCNVIGTAGSVVPIFRRQIAERRPVTVTDPQATRWFLTTGEAVDAILGSGLAPLHGKIFLPPVGDPVRIADLARFLIDSAGDQLRNEVRYTGLRPGEKLTEELLCESERPAEMEGLLEVIDTPRLDAPKLRGFVDELAARIAHRDLPGLLQSIGRVSPEYVPSIEVLRQAAASVVSA